MLAPLFPGGLPPAGTFLGGDSCLQRRMGLYSDLRNGTLPLGRSVEQRGVQESSKRDSSPRQKRETRGVTGPPAPISDQGLFCARPVETIEQLFFLGQVLLRSCSFVKTVRDPSSTTRVASSVSCLTNAQLTGRSAVPGFYNNNRVCSRRDSCCVPDSVRTSLACSNNLREAPSFRDRYQDGREVATRKGKDAAEEKCCSGPTSLALLISHQSLSRASNRFSRFGPPSESPRAL